MKYIYIIVALLLTSVWIVEIFDIINLNKVEKLIMLFVYSIWLFYGAFFVKKKYNSTDS